MSYRCDDQKGSHVADFRDCSSQDIRQCPRQGFVTAFKKQLRNIGYTKYILGTVFQGDSIFPGSGGIVFEGQYDGRDHLLYRPSQEQQPSVSLLKPVEAQVWVPV